MFANLRSPYQPPVFHEDVLKTRVAPFFLYPPPLPSPTFSPLLGYYSYWGAMNGVHSATVILDYRTSGVPQNVDVVPEGSIPSLQRPKSVKTT